MLHKRSAALILAVSLPALAGCVQATRHSNTMVFGTNTNVGLKIGQNVNQVPEVIVGFDRQEAVIMPLLANASEKSSSGNLLTPCALEKETEWTLDANGKPTSVKTTYADGTKDILHPCKFVGARKGKEDFLIQDSYSVLASFGARIEGKGSSGEGAVGLAQYFSTGAAAQTLALNGGAAVVSVGEAASNASKNSTNTANAAAALTGSNPVPPMVVESVPGCGRDQLRNYLRLDLTDDERKRRRGIALNAAKAGGLGTLDSEVFIIEQGGPEWKRAGLVYEIKKIEKNEVGLKDLGECK